MKKKFSTAWKASKQRRKQRKYRANAPLHIKRKFVSVNLSKELRKKYGKRNVPVRKGDTVRILRGKYKKKEGKILEVLLKRSKVIIEGIQIKKADGSKANVKLVPSNMQIIILNTDDKKRIKTKEHKEHPKVKVEIKENKEDKK